MSEEKRNRITVAVTINAVLLVFILFAVVIAQIVTIGVMKNRAEQIRQESEEIQKQIDEELDELAKLEQDEQYRKSQAQQLIINGYRP